jgi:hypothetical protein
MMYQTVMVLIPITLIYFNWLPGFRTSSMACLFDYDSRLAFCIGVSHVNMCPHKV